MQDGGWLRVISTVTLSQEVHILCYTAAPLIAALEHGPSTLPPHLLLWPDSCCRPAECVWHLQVVLGQSKTDPSKYVAMKVVYLRSPDVLDDPEHLAILRRWGRSGQPHPCSKHCMRLVLPDQSCSACCEGLNIKLFTRTATQAGLAGLAYLCPVAV